MAASLRHSPGGTDSEATLAILDEGRRIFPGSKGCVMPAIEDREEQKPARRPLTADEALRERLDQGQRYWAKWMRKHGIDR